MKDFWQEIIITMTQNKLRTVLTGFSIAWGIFMLIILLSAGNGIKHATENSFSRMDANTITLYANSTTMPYNGLQSGRRIKFMYSDFDFLQKHLPNAINFSPVYTNWSGPLQYDNNYVTAPIKGVNTNYFNLIKLNVVKGRLINRFDEETNRKVLVMSEKTVPILFKNEDPIGKVIVADSVAFTVIGIYKDNSSNMNFSQPSVYIPLSTAQLIFNSSGDVYQIAYELKNVKLSEATAYTNKLRLFLSKYYNYSSDDHVAIWIDNNWEDAQTRQKTMGGLNAFIWLIGLGTLIAGIVGVGNIMIVTVRERTHEFGIRKALGATPSSIIRSVIFESLTITTLFGYFGMIIGIGLTELVNSFLNKMPDTSTVKHVILDPTVDLRIVLAATVLLILAGLLAGYFPARKAVKIKPIEAIMAK